MFDVNSRVQVRFRGEPYLGTVKLMKWGIALIDFDMGMQEWINISKLEKPNVV